MIDFWTFLAYVIGMAIWLRLVVFLNHKSGDIFGLYGLLLGTGDPCPCCGMPIKSTNPEMLRLLTDIRDFGFSLRNAERVAALLKKEQEAADGTM